MELSVQIVTRQSLSNGQRKMTRDAPALVMVEVEVLKRRSLTRNNYSLSSKLNGWLCVSPLIRSWWLTELLEFAWLVLWACVSAQIIKYSYSSQVQYHTVVSYSWASLLCAEACQAFVQFCLHCIMNVLLPYYIFDFLFLCVLYAVLLHCTENAIFFC